MQQAVWNTMSGSSQGEIHADMSESAGEGWATRVNLGCAPDQRDQDQTDSRPNRLQSLTDGDEPDSPADKNRRTEIDHPAELKI